MAREVDVYIPQPWKYQVIWRVGGRSPAVHAATGLSPHIPYTTVSAKRQQFIGKRRQRPNEKLVPNGQTSRLTCRQGSYERGTPR